MGAGVPQRILDKALKRAQRVAEEHTRRYGTPCTARLIRASNGEAAIVYDIKQLNGKVTTISDIAGYWADVEERRLQQPAFKAASLETRIGLEAFEDN